MDTTLIFQIIAGLVVFGMLFYAMVRMIKTQTKSL